MSKMKTSPSSKPEDGVPPRVPAALGRPEQEHGGSEAVSVSHLPLSVLRPTLSISKLAGKVIRGRDWLLTRLCRMRGKQTSDFLQDAHLPPEPPLPSLFVPASP